MNRMRQTDHGPRAPREYKRIMGRHATTCKLYTYTHAHNPKSEELTMKPLGDHNRCGTPSTHGSSKGLSLVTRTEKGTKTSWRLVLESIGRSEPAASAPEHGRVLSLTRQSTGLGSNQIGEE